MSFEGSEKKVEITVDKGLRGLGRDFWEKMVERSGARIISTMEGSTYRAYLLSESSLFVRDNALIMITCGNSHLVDGVVYFCDEFGVENIHCLIYQRKKEFWAHLQGTSFPGDVRRLRERLGGGEALRFGHLSEHHNSVFWFGKNFKAPEKDRTTELLMHHVRGPTDSPGDLGREFQKMGLEVDDFIFTPRGYSLNAIGENYYATVHMTPEEDSSYVSLETNFPPGPRASGLLGKMITTFRPMSFDILGFNTEEDLAPRDFARTGHFRERLGCGYLVDFKNFVATDTDTQRPFVVGEGGV